MQQNPFTLPPRTMRTNRQIEDFLAETSVALSNARESKIQHYLSPVGYSRERLDAGRRLLDAAKAATARHQAAHVRFSDARRKHREAVATVRATYLRHVALLRVVLAGDGEAIRTLDLRGRRPAARDALLQAAEAFYEALLRHEHLQAAAEQVGVNETAMRDGLSAIEDARAHAHRRRERRAAAVRSTEERGAAVAALRAWMGDFWAIAKIVLADDRPLYGALGRTYR